MTNEETDTALILENELTRRVTEIVNKILRAEIRRQLNLDLSQAKADMLLEISISVGQMLASIERDGREPLWVSGPKAMKAFNHAIHEETPSV